MKLKYIITVIVCLLFLNRGVAQQFNFWQFTAQNGLSSSNINCLHQTTDGELWIGTDLGVSIYDGLNFKNYNVFDNLFNDQIKKIVQANNGEVWVLHQNGGLSSFLDNTFTSHEHIYDTVVDIANISGKLYFITTKKVFEMKGQEAIAMPVHIKQQEVFKSITNLFGKPAFKTSEEIYYKTVEKPLVNKAGGEVLTYNKQKYTISHNQIHSGNYSVTLLDKIKTTYLKDSLLYCELSNSIQLVNLSNVKPTKEDIIPLPTYVDVNSITGILVDDEGTLWIGTISNGLLALPKENFALINYAKSELKGVSSCNNIRYLIFDNEVQRLNKNKTTVTVYKNNNQSITAYHQKQNGEQWIGTANGLSIVIPGTSISYSFKELRGQAVTFIGDYQDGVLVGTNRSVFQYIPQSNKIIDFYAVNGLPQIEAKQAFMLGADILIMHADRIIKVTDGDVTQLFKLNDKRLKNVSFTTINKQFNGGYWIGTKEKGLIQYNNETNFNFLSDSINLPLQNISAVQQENESVIWCSSPSGIARINNREKTFIIYNQRYLKNIQFINCLPIVIERDILFVDKKGLINIHPNRFKELNLDSVYITSFLANGKEVNRTPNLKLPYGVNSIGFSFKTKSLKNIPYYQYKLNGIQKNWTQPTREHTVNYNGLKAGKYTFVVRQINPLTKEQGEETSFSFKIKIPFFKSGLFYWLIAIGGFLILLFVYILRIFRLRLQKKKLKALVEEKTFQLSVQKKHLEQLSYSLSHDLKNPVNNIKGLVEILADNRTDDVVKMLDDSTRVLEDKIIATLSSIKKARANIKEVKLIQFNELYAKVERSLLMLIKQKNAKIEVDFIAKNIQYEESLLESILYNLVSNSIKYKHPNRSPDIVVVTEQINEFIRLTVSDNGIGIDLAKDQENIFSIFKRVHTNEEGTGIGLYMIKQMVEINGGSIEVESELGKGSTFHVYLKNLK